jgi:hypothetical protein
MLFPITVLRLIERHLDVEVACCASTSSFDASPTAPVIGNKATALK